MVYYLKIFTVFYAEGGPACLQSKVAELRDCGQKLKDSVSTVEEAKAMSLDVSIFSRYVYNHAYSYLYYYY